MRDSQVEPRKKNSELPKRYTTCRVPHPGYIAGTAPLPSTQALHGSPVSTLPLTFIFFSRGIFFYVRSATV